MRLYLEWVLLRFNEVLPLGREVLNSLKTQVYLSPNLCGSYSLFKYACCRNRVVESVSGSMWISSSSRLCIWVNKPRNIYYLAARCVQWDWSISQRSNSHASCRNSSSRFDAQAIFSFSCLITLLSRLKSSKVRTSSTPITFSATLFSELVLIHFPIRRDFNAFTTLSVSTCWVCAHNSAARPSRARGWHRDICTIYIHIDLIRPGWSWGCRNPLICTLNGEACPRGLGSCCPAPGVGKALLACCISCCICYWNTAQGLG